jgi:hypothetical protein
MNIKLNDAVSTFLKTLSEGAEDSHEFENMLARSINALGEAYKAQAQQNREALVLSVLAERARRQGVTVEQLKAEAANAVGEHPSKLTATAAFDILVERPKRTAPAGKRKG